MMATGVTPLPVYHRHALQVATLPLHHRDPFDRLLVAQAQLETLPILTADHRLRRYDIEVMLAHVMRGCSRFRERTAESFRASNGRMRGLLVEAEWQILRSKSP